MILIDLVTMKWVETIGGDSVIFQILSLVFVFMLMFVFYKITT